MKSILLVISILFSFNQLPNYATYYCIAKDGVILRKGPTTQSEKIAAIPFADSMILIKSYYKEYKDTLLVKGIPCDGYWDNVVYKGDTGYVFNAYILSVSPILKPEYLYHHTLFYSKNVTVEYDSDHRGDGRAQRGFNYDRIIKRYTIHTNASKAVMDTLSYQNSLDSFKEYVKLEMVDKKDYPFNSKYNLFKIDTTHVEINVPFDTTELDYNRSENDIPSDVSSFDLKLNNGKWLHFQDVIYMFGDHYKFIGRVKALNAYVVERSEELGPIYEYYSIEDGRLIYSGSPSSYISSNKKHLVDFTYDDMYRTEAVVWMSVSQLNDTLAEQKNISFQIEFWTPSFKPGDAYWISNTELIVPFLPNHLFGAVAVYPYLHNEKVVPEIDWQYLKLTIL